MKTQLSNKRPRIFDMSFASIYKLYIAKANRKNRSQDEVDKIIYWLTGYDKKTFKTQIDELVSNQTFFDEAPEINPNVHLISGSICGYKVQDIADPLMKKIRYLDKLIDELAQGKQMEKILKSEKNLKK
jgi:hypothetical protein